MATTISKLAILLSLNPQGLTSGVTTSVREVDRLENRIGRFGRAWANDLGTDLIGRLSGALAATAALDLATDAWRAGLEGAADAVDRIGGQVDTAAAVGVDQADIARLEYAAQLSGVAEEAVGRSLAKMQDFVAEAADAGSAQAQTLAELGLTSGGLAGMDGSERFLAIAQAIGEIEDPAQRVRLAMDVFGKSGADLVPIFAAGRDAIEAAFKQADRFGLSLDAVDANAVDELGDRIGDVEKAIEGAYNALVVEAAPGMIDSVNTLTDAIVVLKDNAEGFHDVWYALSMPALWHVRALDALLKPMGGAEATASNATGGRGPFDAEAAEAAAEAATKIADEQERATAAAVRMAESQAAALQSQADALIDSLLTPAERFTKEVQGFFDLYGSGKLSDEFLDRAIADAEERFAQLSDRGERALRSDVALPQFTLAERGTAAAFAAERAGQTELAKLAANSDKSLIWDEKQATEMTELTRLWREQGGVTLVYQPIL